MSRSQETRCLAHGVFQAAEKAESSELPSPTVRSQFHRISFRKHRGGYEEAARGGGGGVKTLKPQVAAIRETTGASSQRTSSWLLKTRCLPRKVGF